MKGIVFDIKQFAIHDGPGIRTTVFLKGCPLRCWWCHNPEGQDVGPEIITKNALLDGDEFEKIETVGKLMSVESVIEILQKETIFYDESGGGVTFSGGEPLFQPVFLTNLLKASKEKGFHTAVDTCGCAKTGYSI
jgi:pyruvate formate lyase activating enzyme